MTDFHSHVIPRVDDGSRSSAMSIEMLKAMKNRYMSEEQFEEIRRLIDILFDTLESSGAKTFTEIYADKWNYYNAIRKAVVKLAPEQLSVLFDVAGQFLAAGKEVIMEDRKSGDVKQDPDTDQ